MIPKFKTFRTKMAMLQALKVPLFYPKNGHEIRGTGVELWRNVGCKSLFTVSDFQWVLAAPKDERWTMNDERWTIRKASRNQEKVEMRGKEPQYRILNWSCNQHDVTWRDILTFLAARFEDHFSGQNSVTLNACNIANFYPKRLKLPNGVFQTFCCILDKTICFFL